jgi:hypothetical protein
MFWANSSELCASLLVLSLPALEHLQMSTDWNFPEDDLLNIDPLKGSTCLFHVESTSVWLVSGSWRHSRIMQLCHVTIDKFENEGHRDLEEDNIAVLMVCCRSSHLVIASSSDRGH